MNASPLDLHFFGMRLLLSGPVSLHLILEIRDGTLPSCSSSVDIKSDRGVRR